MLQSTCLCCLNTLNILGVSKIKMHSFLYDTLCNKIGRDNLRFIYSDTDSLMLSIQCQDLYETLKLIIDELDTSNFPTDHCMYRSENKKVPGKWVLEMKNNPIKFACVLSSKAYSISMVNSNSQTPVDIMKLRGFPQRILRQHLRPENYRNALFDLKEMFKTFPFYRIESKNNELFTIRHKRAVLMCHYIKSVVKPDCVDTIPFGHKDCKEYC